MKIYINGRFYPKEEAKVSVFDHGVLYGDGIFEGIRAYNGRVFMLQEHIDRLYDSSKVIALSMPIRKEEMVEAVLETVRANGLMDAYIRLLVTRGEGNLGLNPFQCRDPQVIIIADKIVLYPEEFYREGLTLVTVPTQRNLPEAVNPRIKSLNYLNNIMAKIEAINAGVAEAVMLNCFGFIAECTGDNIFTVRKGTILTPSIYMGSLEGITRNVVIELARKANYTVKQIVMSRHDLFTGDECFLTGTAAEIIPVVKCDGRVIGDGKPGPITLRLMKNFQDLVQCSGVEIYPKGSVEERG